MAHIAAQLEQHAPGTACIKAPRACTWLLRFVCCCRALSVALLSTGLPAAEAQEDLRGQAAQDHAPQRAPAGLLLRHRKTSLTTVSWMQGWDWVNEGQRPEAPKWGYISTTPGVHLTAKASPALVSDSSSVRCVCLHLRSWQLMLSCASSPACVESKPPSRSFKLSRLGRAGAAGASAGAKCESAGHNRGALASYNVLAEQLRVASLLLPVQCCTLC